MGVRDGVASGCTMCGHRVKVPSYYKIGNVARSVRDTSSCEGGDSLSFQF